MDQIMELTALFPIIFILEFLAIVFSLLFMHYSAKQKNYNLSTAWYVCGVLFGFWTVIVFLIKRKDFPGENFKVCSQCGNKYPVNYEICSKCLIELPQINPEEKAKEKKRAKIFGWGIIVTYVVTFIVSIIFGAVFASDIFNSFLDSTDRISVNGVFYDKKGISYETAEDVLLYDEEGRTYTQTVETVSGGEDGDFEYEDYFYVRDDGEKYYLYDCYVTEDGWFYCDKGGLLDVYYPDTESMSEEELDAYYKEQMEINNGEYKYYYYPYTDNKGNIYYNAYEASWNEKGELITEKNDTIIK